VDAGAYVGGYSVRASKLGAEVVSLEPDRESFSLLQRNLEFNKCSKVHSLNVAAGVKEEMKPLYAPDNDGYGHSLMRKGAARGDVEVKPLDKAVLPFVGDSPVQLTKIDVEGAELEVLNGATAILDRSNYLMIEIWPHNWDRVLNLLRRHKFKRVDIGRRWSGTNEVNVFFRRT
jgi:FkbM family methyltransferase